MISWLLGSKLPEWEYLRDLFQDVENAAVYASQEDVVELVKMSDIDPLHSQVTVLIHPKNIEIMKVGYLKLRNYVAFPVMRLEDLRAMVSMKGWRAIEYYDSWEFQGGWILYDCVGCEEEQRKQLKIDFRDRGAVETHIRIWKMFRVKEHTHGKSL
ncbi:hypothetical protein L3N51_02088 [Metallosphaera sp. J1]|uniref:hypothetical protein n=1 Tax=Metallosphaera TaxID=41980 RepID=UPI001EDE95B9|nr:hypothetical protein [Metallosphaera javensis (ex Hofmann et al. 2022)]MCG3109792.1 hypothetical protein [Metallosphaera javensis (ex Hofmann et al. 2022)]BCS92681.1 MAG: hypothetical protein MjAS7_1289 [Metallosphaera javensis (ex Sakai et al. 2022)]